MMSRAGYLRVLASVAGLLAASLSLLVVGQGALGLVCEPSWSTVASGEHINKPSAIVPSLATIYGSWGAPKTPRTP
jgi:hypothetical protein